MLLCVLHIFMAHGWLYMWYKLVFYVQLTHIPYTGRYKNYLDPGISRIVEYSLLWEKKMEYVLVCLEMFFRNCGYGTGQKMLGNNHRYLDNAGRIRVHHSCRISHMWWVHCVCPTLISQQLNFMVFLFELHRGKIHRRHAMNSTLSSGNINGLRT